MRMILCLAAACIATTAIAQEPPPYLDDRSDAKSLVSSYYNAINRAEYARAFGYFGEGDAPTSYDSWEFGYSDTSYVTVDFGEVSEEGAAGSIMFWLPVKLEAETTEGQKRYFAGCYQLRLANPSIQGVPYKPMHVIRAHIKESTEDAGPPESC